MSFSSLSSSAFSGEIELDRERVVESAVVFSGERSDIAFYLIVGEGESSFTR